MLKKTGASRLVYEVVDVEILVVVIAIGKRDHDEVYKIAAQRDVRH